MIEVEPSGQTRDLSATNIAALVPAYNERTRIGPVLDLVLGLEQAGFVDVVCVVDHNSTDGTGEYAAEYDPSVKVFRSDRKGRKDAALLDGFRALRGYDSILTLDADLRNRDGGLPINPDFAHRLVETHLENRRYTVVSPLEAGYSRIVPLGGLTGKRIMPMEAILRMPIDGMGNWGYEIKSSLDAFLRGLLKVVGSGEVGHVCKGDKFGVFNGIARNISMGRSVAQAGMAHLVALQSPNGYLTIDEFLAAEQHAA